MFTGIIEELGIIQQISCNKIKVECKTILSDAKIGDSIAVNGVCLTVTDIDSRSFVADVSPETMRVTTLGMLDINDYVNLERAMLSGGRFGGHIVSGHIDGCGKLYKKSLKNDFYDVKIKLNEEQIRYTVKKGSITIDGISLTIANIENNIISLSVIPHTYENTNLKYLSDGDSVNIEIDIMAKYIEKFLLTSDNKSRIDYNFLQENGF